jgi:ABC-2 type transport system permease protein
VVATLVRLRFLLLVNQLKRSPLQLVLTVLGAIYGLFVLGLLVVGQIGLSFASIEVARTVGVLAGALVVLGWTVLPVLTSGIDQTVDPGRLAHFPVRRDALLLGLAVSGVLGVPGIVTLIAALATAGTWWRHPLAAVAALVCGAIGTLTAVCASRMLVALAARVAIGRRAREIKTLLVIVPLILLGPIITLLTGAISDLASVLPRVADVVGVTPLGAIWAVPGDLAAGRFGLAAGEFAIGLGTLAVVVALWRWGLARALERPVAPKASRASTRGAGFFGVFPGTQTGAVAARALTYWVRDPRYAQSLVSVPLVPLLVVFYSSLAGDSGWLPWIGPIVAVLLSISLYTDTSYDSTAFALHVQTGVRGVADRAGRVGALLLFALPVSIAVTVGGVAFAEAWPLLPGMLGIVVGVLLSGCAISSLLSALWIFEVPAPGESAFKSRPGGALWLTLWTFAAWFALAVLALPQAVTAIVGFATASPTLGWIALAVGVVWGAAQLVLGVRIGGRLLDRRAPILLERLQRLR